MSCALLREASIVRFSARLRSVVGKCDDFLFLNHAQRTKSQRFLRGFFLFSMH